MARLEYRHGKSFSKGGNDDERGFSIDRAEFGIRHVLKEPQFASRSAFFEKPKSKFRLLIRSVFSQNVHPRAGGATELGYGADGKFHVFPRIAAACDEDCRRIRIRLAVRGLHAKYRPFVKSGTYGYTGCKRPLRK